MKAPSFQPSRVRRFWRLALAPVGGVVALIVWRSRASEPAPASAGPAATSAAIFGIGSLQATLKAEISPKQSDRITEIRVQAGDAVRAGQVVAILQNDQAEAVLARRKAEAAAAASTVAGGAADLAREELAREKARKDWLRLQAIAEHGHDAVSRSDLETAAATFAEEEASGRKLAAVLAQDRAAETAAQAAVTEQQSLMDDDCLAAPFAGIVTQRLHSVGDTVLAGDPVVEVVDPQTLYVAVQLDESFLAAMHPGMPVRLNFGPGASVRDGRVLRIDRTVDRDTREFIVEVGVDEAPPIWALNQRVEASFPR